ncbi:beta-defensin 108B [Ursus maritimus]|uniref:Beta-defensin 108B n=2 Tax=Ursus maritimus TaxID=29073 RepID=A0A8M1GTN6_URSMA|nr:beta-defensin 108B [Ursus maritimus]
MRFGRVPISQTHSLCGCPESRGRKCLCLLEMGPSFLLSAAVRPAALLLTILFCMSQVLPARGRFKEVCERPNGACQEFCLESELQAGRCLNGQPCCLPMGNEPLVEPTTPKE